MRRDGFSNQSSLLADIHWMPSSSFLLWLNYAVNSTSMYIIGPDFWFHLEIRMTQTFANLL